LFYRYDRSGGRSGGGLAIIISIFRNRESLNVDEVDTMRL
jgi:NADH:ubiquinone oxidoreductase subunit K